MLSSIVYVSFPLLIRHCFFYFLSLTKKCICISYNSSSFFVTYHPAITFTVTSLTINGFIFFVTWDHLQFFSCETIKQRKITLPQRNLYWHDSAVICPIIEESNACLSFSRYALAGTDQPAYPLILFHD